MSLDSLQDLFLDGLKDIYDAEKQLLKALKKMVKSANSDELKEAFESHLQETEGQVERLEQVFETLGKAARGKKCAAMEGLVEEGSEIMSEDGAESVLDAALIGAAQKVEHYEIATYGTLSAWAKQMGEKEIVKLIEANLAEEKAADKKLSEIASALNFEANEADVAAK